MTSAAGEPLTLSGIRVPKAPGIRKRPDVIPTLLATYPSRLRRKPPYWEPRWGDVTECLKAANTIRISNYMAVSAGLGMTPSPVEDLRIVRNYIAHRRTDTANKLAAIYSKYGMSKVDGVYRIVTLQVIGAIPLFVQWIRQLQMMSEVSLQ